MIEPTVGRIVWYRPNGISRNVGIVADRHQPYAAMITEVIHARRVEIVVFGGGTPSIGPVTCDLMQDGDKVPAPGADYCEWMPYQKGQAAKTEALETQLAAKG